MIDTIIFTKDRACQLDLLLQSIVKNGNNLFNINILYEASSQEYKDGYLKVSERFPSYERFNWVEEEDFEKDTLELLNKSGKLVCFFVDDNILYRPLELNQEEVEDIVDDDIFCLSLRLGGNTVVQSEYDNSMCVLPSQVTLINDTFLAWDWRHLPPFTNFSYPFSVDGHIYRREEVLKIVSQYEFVTPNAFEGMAYANTGCLGNAPSRMTCLKRSVLVNTPLNLVGSSENKSGQKFGKSLQELNEEYLSGNIPDFDGMDFSEVRGCHQEIEIKFKRESDVRAS